MKITCLLNKKLRPIGQIVLSTLLSFFIFSSYGQQFTLDWVNSHGNNTTNSCRSLDVVVDSDNNIINTGYFSATVDFDPGSGVHNITSNAGGEIYVQKLDSDGNFIWAISFVDNYSGTNIGEFVTSDSQNNVYISGYFWGTVDFDPGSGTHNITSNGGRDGYIVKLDSNGDLVWVVTFGDTSHDSCEEVSIDKNGNVIATGNFSGSVDFDNSASNTILTGFGDVFVLKLNSNGQFQWVYQIGGDELDYGFTVSTDSNMNVIVGGRFRDTVNFDPYGQGDQHVSLGGDDAFILKLNGNGSYLWSYVFGGTSSSSEYVKNIKTDSANNIIAVGCFGGNVEFDPGVSSTNAISHGGRDLFFLKISHLGTYVWSKTTGSQLDDNGFGVYIDENLGLLFNGTFQNSIDFDPSSSNGNHVSNGSSDNFLLILNENSNYVFSYSYGSATGEAVGGVETDSASKIVLSGSFQNTVDFDPTVGTNNQTANQNGGYSAIFTAKYSYCSNNTGIDLITACDSYTWIDGVTYSSNNNTATYTLTNVSGCDSVVTLDLTINSSNTGVDVISACDSYTWIDGVTYTSNNNSATHILTNASGCDSIVTLDLTINSSNTGVDVVSSCDSYTWIDGVTYTSNNNSATHILTNVSGCDSVVTLDLTIISSNTGVDVISACDSYTWIDGVTYTSNNNSATHTLTNVSGCDSVVTLDLTINSSNTGVDIVTACDSYTWIDGVTYTSNNNSATHTLTNTSGCDSVVTLDLTISTSNTGVDVVTACDSYTWIDGVIYTSNNNSATHTLTNVSGCDSVVTLDLTINSSNTGVDVISACDSYTWIDGVTYTSNNNSATHTLTNVSGCDSVVSLNLTINITPDNGISQVDQTLVASANGVQYLWLDCEDDFSIIPNATDQIFTPIISGEYAVQISDGICIDTSECINFQMLHLPKEIIEYMEVYPNPSNDRIYLKANFSSLQTDRIVVLDSKGKIVMDKPFDNEPINIKSLSNGIYLLRVGSNTIRFIKN